MKDTLSWLFPKDELLRETKTPAEANKWSLWGTWGIGDMICSLLCLWVSHVKCYPMTVAVSLAPLPFRAPCSPTEPQVTRMALWESAGGHYFDVVCFWKLRVRLDSRSRPASNRDARVFPPFAVWWHLVIDFAFNLLHKTGDFLWKRSRWMKREQLNGFINCTRRR